MNADVTIDFAGGVASTSLVQVSLTGASFGLLTNDGVSTAIPLPNLAVAAGHLTVATQPGGQFNGKIKLTLLGQASSLPVVTLNNLVPGSQRLPATIAWPSAAGTQTQILTPGDPLTLNGIAWSNG
ncbi:MAG TPA: hypothetical protein VN029_11295 [Sphingomonas sp.]|nr:hypothetical protein [Sphingomonas sp.]